MSNLLPFFCNIFLAENFNFDNKRRNGKYLFPWWRLGRGEEGGILLICRKHLLGNFLCLRNKWESSLEELCRMNLGNRTKGPYKNVFEK